MISRFSTESTVLATCVSPGLPDDPDHNEVMVDEAVIILARWVRELQEEVIKEQKTNGKLAKRVTELEHQIGGFAYWMRVGKTPARIKQLAGSL